MGVLSQPPDERAVEKTIRDATIVMRETEKLLSFERDRMSPVPREPRVSRESREARELISAPDEEFHLTPVRLYQQRHDSLRVGGPGGSLQQYTTFTTYEPSYVAVRVLHETINLDVSIDISLHLCDAVAFLAGVFQKECGLLPCDPLTTALYVHGVDGWCALPDPMPLEHGDQLLLIKNGASFPASLPPTRTPVLSVVDDAFFGSNPYPSTTSCALPYLQGVDYTSTQHCPVASTAPPEETDTFVLPPTSDTSVVHPEPSPSPSPSSSSSSSSSIATSASSVNTERIAMESHLTTIEQQDRLMKRLLQDLENANIERSEEKVLEGKAIMESGVLGEVQKIRAEGEVLKSNRRARKIEKMENKKKEKEAKQPKKGKAPGPCVCFVRSADTHSYNQRAMCLDVRQGVDWLTLRTTDTAPEVCIEVEMESIISFALFNEKEAASATKGLSMYISTPTLAWVVVAPSPKAVEEWISWVTHTYPAIDSELKMPPLPVPPCTSPSRARER